MIFKPWQREVRERAAKTVRGHVGRRRISIQYVCECGWVSCQFFGKGATAQAANDFRSHKEQIVCEAMNAEADPS